METETNLYVTKENDNEMEDHPNMSAHIQIDGNVIFEMSSMSSMPPVTMLTTIDEILLKVFFLQYPSHHIQLCTDIHQM